MPASSLLGHRPFDPPVTPDADEARQWAQEELAKSIYSQGDTLWDRILDWLADLWDRLFDGSTGLGPVLLPVVVVLVAALLVGIALLIGGPVRRRRLRRSGSSVEVLDDDTRTASAIRAAADAAAEAGDYARAVLERFRAIVRALDERAILEDRRGRTAHEAAAAAGARLAPCAADLLRASEMFDGVCYGEQVPGADDDAWLRELDQRVGRTRPSRTGDVTDAELTAPR